MLKTFGSFIPSLMSEKCSIVAPDFEDKNASDTKK